MAKRTAVLERMLALVDRDRVVSELMEFVSIPSVNPFSEEASPDRREREFGIAYAGALLEVGLVPQHHEPVPGRTNVVARLPGDGTGPSVMLAGHLDTVGVDDYPKAFDPRVRRGRLHGRGSCDMKAALAAYVEVARVIGEVGVTLPGDLVIAGLCDEEHTMIGSRDLGERPPLADVAIIGEPTGLEVCPAHKGQVCLVIRTLGRAVHSSRPELGENAIVAMTDAIRALESYGATLTMRPPHPLCGHGRVNPGVITGGTIASTVPDVCELEIDRRTLPGETREQVFAEITMVLDALAADVPAFRYELDGPTLLCAALDTAPDEPVVQALLRARSATLGGPSEVTAFPAATDAPNLGMPAVVCGPGRLEQAHTTDEFVEIDEVMAAVEIYLRTIVDVMGAG